MALILPPLCFLYFYLAPCPTAKFKTMIFFSKINWGKACKEKEDCVLYVPLVACMPLLQYPRLDNIEDIVIRVTTNITCFNYSALTSCWKIT